MININPLGSNPDDWFSLFQKEVICIEIEKNIKKNLFFLLNINKLNNFNRNLTYEGGKMFIFAPV